VDDRRPASLLDAQEIAVLRMLSRRHSTAETARTLRVSVQEVQRILRHLLRRLGVRSKLDAILVSVRDGIIEQPH
jgi:DNA-binding CsgD family transcriptional regulator